jgi:hypothetical protein
MERRGGEGGEGEEEEELFDVELNFRVTALS